MANQTTAATHDRARPMLSPDAAFVLQLTANSRLASAGCAGRVEHIASGSWDYFDSLAELLAFVDRALERPASSERA